MDTNERPVDAISVVGPEAITERQREVARLVAAGLTNGQIAEELGITLDGAKFHVSGLLTRLGLRRREEVAEWYRAHFRPAARMRAWVRGLVALPAAGWIGAASMVGGSIAVAVVVLAVRGGAVAPEIASPDYVPFVQEWEISYVDQETQYGTLDWVSCAEWTYELRDAAGNVLGSTRSEGEKADGSCHIPGFWFVVISPFDLTPNGDAKQLAPYIFEQTLRRPCDATEGWSPTEALPADFCADPDGTFEDRTRVEFDATTEIPVRYVQYVDGVVVHERRSTSLKVR